MNSQSNSSKLIVTPLFLAWDRPADFQRQTCRALVMLGHKVIVYDVHHPRFFLKPRSAMVKERGVEFYQPVYVVPGQRFRWIKRINENAAFLLFCLRKRSFIFWTFSQESVQYVSIIKKAFASRIATIYDCVDYFHWPNSPSSFAKARTIEQEHIQAVDFFFTNSQTLARLHRKTRIPDAILPPGLDLSSISEVNKLQISTLPRSVGYLGELGQRIDWKLLDVLTKTLLKHSFYFIGDVCINQLGNKQLKLWKNIQSRKNVYHFPHLLRIDALLKIKQCEICIIPYNHQQNNTYSFPMKFVEYIALGKPVVSSSINELKNYSQRCTFPKTFKDWIKEVSSKQLSHRVPTEFTRKYSWSAKISKIISHVVSLS